MINLIYNSVKCILFGITEQKRVQPHSYWLSASFEYQLNSNMLRNKMSPVTIAIRVFNPSFCQKVSHKLTAVLRFLLVSQISSQRKKSQNKFGLKPTSTFVKEVDNNSHITQSNKGEETQI